jgi:hypothetical protein
VCGGHKDSRIVACQRLEQRKRCIQSSQFANAVLH